MYVLLLEKAQGRTWYRPFMDKERFCLGDCTMQTPNNNILILIFLY
jgi:hypothetical protein